MLTYQELEYFRLYCSLEWTILLFIRHWVTRVILLSLWDQFVGTVKLQICEYSEFTKVVFYKF